MYFQRSRIVTGHIRQAIVKLTGKLASEKSSHSQPTLLIEIIGINVTYWRFMDQKELIGVKT